MRITTQRVARDGDEGINAFVYWHGRDIANDDPVALLDADPGTLQVRLIEVEPGGNRVRSYLDVVVPDQATSAQIDAVLDSFTHMPVPSVLPAVWRKGSAAARFACDEPLAPVWDRELAELVELARAGLHSMPSVRAVPRYGTIPGALDALEQGMVDDAARRKDVESVLSLLRQLARAQRLTEMVHAIDRFASTHGDPRIRAFLADLLPGLLANAYFPTLGVAGFERFVAWSLATPRWSDPLVCAAKLGDADEWRRQIETVVAQLR